MPLQQLRAPAPFVTHSRSSTLIGMLIKISGVWPILSVTATDNCCTQNQVCRSGRGIFGEACSWTEEPVPLLMMVWVNLIVGWLVRRQGTERPHNKLENL